MNPPDFFRDLLHQRTGPLTRELLLRPGGFGLGQVPARLRPEATVPMVCGFCSTGCGLNVHLQEGRAVNLTPAADYPVNRGMACPKGWEALTPLGAADRATVPLRRDASGRHVATDWETALRMFVSRFQEIQQRHGPEAVAFLSTGQIATEEMALLGAVAKFGMGLVHGDGNTRQCMASAVVAYKESFGFDAPPYTYRDLEESDVIVLVGSNLCIAHPILWERVMRNPHRPEIVVIDPRRTETAMQATLHLSVRPKSDQTLFYGLTNLLIAADAVDRPFIEAHTRGFEELAAFVAPYTVEHVAAETGLTADTLRRFAEIVRGGKRVSYWWTMGVNQSHQGVRTAQAIINVVLMTGQIGRPGTGANSITGQCNAMGSRLFSNTSCLLGGRDFAEAAHRRTVADVLRIDEGRIPRHAGWAYPDIIEGILRGHIRGLWIIGTNPAHSWINQHQLHDILDRLDFLVVQEMFHSTETARRADLLLPAAAWGEKEGTFINSERRLGRIRKVARAPGQALSDFAIVRLIAQAWGCGGMFARWDSPAAVFEVLKRLSAGQPCDFTGIGGYDDLDAAGIQWPFPAGSADRQPERRLFADGRFFHADSRARFIAEPPRPLPEPLTDRYPFLLLTGRGSAAQWHTQTRTAKSAVLRKLHPESLYVEINPTDARRLGIAPHDPAVIESQRGRLVATAFLTPAIPPGQIFLPMHDAAVNQLTDSVFDPYSKQPAYKACAANVRRSR